MATRQVIPLKSVEGPKCACVSPIGAIDRSEIESRGAVLAALGDPIRLGILELLSQHDRLCVCHIAEAFPVEQPTISHHLRLLREANLVDVERRGHWAYYGLRRDTVKRVAQNLVDLL
jgi:ArsR family transcriptional regulator